MNRYKKIHIFYLHLTCLCRLCFYPQSHQRLFGKFWVTSRWKCACSRATFRTWYYDKWSLFYIGFNQCMCWMFTERCFLCFDSDFKRLADILTVNIILFRSLLSQTLRPKQYNVALLDKACCWCPEQWGVRLQASTAFLSLHCWIGPWTFNYLKRRIYPILDQVRCSGSTLLITM